MLTKKYRATVRKGQEVLDIFENEKFSTLHNFTRFVKRTLAKNEQRHGEKVEIEIVQVLDNAPSQTIETKSRAGMMYKPMFKFNWTVPTKYLG
jgi:hypothetical protein